LLDGGVHTAAALRTMLPSPFKALSSYASLNRDFLAPHDTINAVATTADGAHGIIEITFAAPTPTFSEGNGFTISGSGGWLSVGDFPSADGSRSRGRIVIHRASAAKGSEPDEILLALRGVEVEVESFLEAVAGQDDGIQNPRNALQDVAFIQAALDSHGQSIDLVKLTAV